MSVEEPIRVLVVDDSRTVRAVLRRLFAPSPDIRVVAEAGDGAEAVEAVLAARPDVVLMDIEMPVLDGFAATERIMRLRPTPIIVLTSRANRNTMSSAFEATRHGAVEILAKPADPAGWEVLADSLPRAVRGAAQLSPTLPRFDRRAVEAEVPLATPRSLLYVAIGASTGGPGALHELLAALPSSPPVVVLVVQHISTGFEAGMADWLASTLPLDVRLAAAGERPTPGAVRVAPSGAHLRLDAGGVLRLDSVTPPRGGHRPSVDELLFSCAGNHAGHTAGVLLSGMGSDGADGLAALRAAGGFTLVQDEATSVVFGMPRAALERGAADLALSPAEIAAALTKCWTEGR